MKNFVAFATLLLASLAAVAATHEEVANAPVQTVDTVYVVIFLVGFVAAIVGFFAYYFFRGQPKDKNGQG